MKKIFLLFNVFCFALLVNAQSNNQSILLLGATAHLGNGKVIENSAIGFKNGQLSLITTAANANPKTFDKTIDLNGKHIYPGFIALDTYLGLRDVDAVRATNDFYETGAYNPNVRALIAYNTDSKVIPTIQSKGVLFAQTAPSGGVISGKSSLFKTHGWNWEDAVFKADDGVYLNFPSLFNSSGWWAEPGPNSKNKEYDKQIQAIRDFLAEAKAYCATDKNTIFNAKLDAMRGLFAKKENLYIRVNQAKPMMEAVLLAEEFGLKSVLIGADDAWQIVDFLKQHKTPLVLQETNRLPTLEDDDIDQPYKTPALLHKAGLLFTFSINGAWEQRDYILQAGQAIGFGLPYEAAVQAATLDAAKIMGVDDKIGSLELGKSASLVISTGDIFEPRTATVEMAFFDGKLLDLNNVQKELYQKYKKKYTN